MRGWAEREEPAPAQGGGFSVGDTAWPGPNPSAALPTPQGCPGPTGAPEPATTAAPRGSPKHWHPTELPCSSLHTLPLGKGWRGIPEPHRGAAPDPPNFLCRNQSWGAAPRQALHAQAGLAPLNRPLNTHPPKPDPPAPELGPILTPGQSPDRLTAPVWESGPPGLIWWPHCHVPGAGPFGDSRTVPWGSPRLQPRPGIPGSAAARPCHETRAPSGSREGRVGIWDRLCHSPRWLFVPQDQGAGGDPGTTALGWHLWVRGTRGCQDCSAQPPSPSGCSRRPGRWGGGGGTAG